MIAKLLLSSMLIAMLAYASVAATRARMVGVLIAASALAGLFFVWWPDAANELANAVGIGRGADLVLYVWVVLSMLVGLNLHLRLKAQAEVATRLARAIALLEVRRAEQSREPRGPGS